MEIKNEYKKTGTIESKTIILQSREYNEILEIVVTKERVNLHAMVDGAGNSWNVSRKRLVQLLESVK